MFSELSVLSLVGHAKCAEPRGLSRVGLVKGAEPRAPSRVGLVRCSEPRAPSRVGLVLVKYSEPRRSSHVLRAECFEPCGPRQVLRASFAERLSPLRLAWRTLRNALGAVHPARRSATSPRHVTPQLGLNIGSPLSARLSLARLFFFGSDQLDSIPLGWPPRLDLRGPTDSGW